ncbi:MAG: hypothetical protein JWP91_3441 [Fibrobacteres bacterium]|nr:hypothetical protein [Fibrobacterota bacterium]
MPSFSLGVAILGLSLAAVHAQPGSVPEPSGEPVRPPAADLARRQASSGNALVTVGTNLMGAGLALGLFGYFPAPRLTGLGVFYVGIPVLGLGALNLSLAAEGVDSTYRRSQSGWTWFLGGLALGAYGIYSLTEIGDGASPGEIMGGVMLVLGSMGCEGMAATRFLEEADHGRRSFAARAASALHPTLIFRAGANMPSPGIRLTYGF